MDKLTQSFEKYDSHNCWPQVFQVITAASYTDLPSAQVARQPENKNFNRYLDVVPFDHSRVKLKRTLPNDYINANVVPVDEAERTYILTQGPLPNTVSHFWVMVWEQMSKAVVMLNRVIERGDIKCSQYWPTQEDPDMHFTDERLSVHFVSQIENQHYSVRNFILTDTETEEQRTIVQFHYTSWPDFSLPESPTDFLDFLQAVRNSEALDRNLHGPAIVHCSAGIGRSGTWCVVDAGLQILSKHTSDKQLSVESLLMQMRKYRAGLVQTPDQFRFCYLALIEGGKKLVSPAEQMQPNPIATFHSSSDSSSDASSSFSNLTEDSATEATVSDQPLASESTSDLEIKPTISTRNTTISSTASTPSAAAVDSSNNICSKSTSDLRRRALERKRSTLEKIQNIKKKQKEIEERQNYRLNLIKYSCISILAASFLVGAGMFINRIS